MSHPPMHTWGLLGFLVFWTYNTLATTCYMTIHRNKCRPKTNSPTWRVWQWTPAPGCHWEHLRVRQRILQKMFTKAFTHSSIQPTLHPSLWLFNWKWVWKGPGMRTGWYSTRHGWENSQCECQYVNYFTVICSGGNPLIYCSHRHFLPHRYTESYSNEVLRCCIPPPPLIFAYRNCAFVVMCLVY